MIFCKIGTIEKLTSFLEQTQQRQIKEHLKRAEANVRNTRADIEEEHRRLEEANGGSHKKRLEEIEAKRADVVAAKNRLQEHESNYGILQRNKEKATAALEFSKGPLAAKQNEMDQCEAQLTRLMQDKGQKQGAYKPSMHRLLTAIQNDSGFREKPVGPMGNHVRLLKPLWSNILEKSFGGTLETFIVTSKPDQSLLLRLMQQNGW